MQVKPTEQQNDSTPRKRRPGRPRGSKNRPRQLPGGSSQKELSQSLFYSYKPAQKQSTMPATAAVTAPPPHPDVNAQNQQYYEFQWRVLNLCAEFYGAAEELVVSPWRLFPEKSFVESVN
jgi:hypothetical protein